MPTKKVKYPKNYIAKNKTNAILVNQLTCKFNEREKNELIAINNFSFDFERNKIYFIIGSSGSGKSTLIMHFNGLLKSRYGEIQVEDFLIPKAAKKIRNSKRLKSIVGVVFQFPEYQLFKSTIEKDISFGPYVLSIPKTKSHEINLNALKTIIFNEHLNKIKAKFKIANIKQYKNIDEVLEKNKITFKCKIKHNKNLAKIFLNKGLINYNTVVYYNTITPKEYAYTIASNSLNLLGLDDSFLDRNPFELSGGQKRRVAISGILAIKPQVLIFDEPTAGLDPQGESEMMDIILQAKNNQQTVIVISHVMDQALSIGDYVIVLDQGKILMHGKPYEVFTNKELYLKTKIYKPKIIEFIDNLIAKDKRFESLYQYQPRNINELVECIKKIV